MRRSKITSPKRRGAPLRLRLHRPHHPGRRLPRRALAGRRKRIRGFRRAHGRRGRPPRRDWFDKLCARHGIAHAPGTVDIGVRVEVRNEVMETVNNVLYESKLIGYPKPFKNKVRTFCQNPGGFVGQENYDNDLAVVSATPIRT